MFKIMTKKRFGRWLRKLENELKNIPEIAQYSLMWMVIRSKVRQTFMEE